MNSLEYSNEALAAKSLFYNKEISVYVEGKDDILFWDSLFQLAEIQVYIEEVGGKEELKKYSDKIQVENADFYTASDNDNSEFLKETIEHPRIIRSYGYSIENSMYYHYSTIEKIISNLCRKKIDVSKEYYDWLNEFCDKVKSLTVLDIANNRFNKGISIFGDTCCRFLKNNDSYIICENRIKEFFDSVIDNFSEAEINEVNELINQSEKKFWFMIKGHFITHSLINFIKYNVKKISGISKSMTFDFLYSMTIDCTQDWESRIDIKLVVERIKEINEIE